MKYLSVCSGIEAASVAWEPLGWEPLAFSEIEPFPSAVLAHHWPDVPNLGDFTTIRRHWFTDGPVSNQLPDVLIGGTPCQAFSVAGLRNSLEDERGNLTLEFVRLADRLDDGRLIVVWENVPGVLNTPDNAFGCFLGALVGSDTALLPPGKRWGSAGVVAGPTRSAAWRVLDAQYFGVAQRRRRVFVVASAREDFDPASVLLERDGVRRDSAPSREPREGAAAGFECGPQGGRWTDLSPTLDTRAKDGPIRNQLGVGVMEPVAFADVSHVKKRQNGPGFTDSGVAFTLTCGDFPGVLEQQDRYEGVHDTVGTLCADTHPGAYSGQDAYTGRLIPDEAPEPQAFRKSARAQASPEAGGFETWVDDGAANTLNCFDVGERDTHAIVEPVAFAQNTRDEVRVQGDGRISGALAAQPGMKQTPYLATQSAVRRLTPRECERLQGFPDDHTRIPWRNKPAEDCPDGPRYKACGNSMAVPVIRWIGRRIDLVALAMAGASSCEEGE